MRKLMEAIQLNEYERTEPVYTEYRDPDGEFVVKYRASRGYYAEGYGVDRAPSFENLDDAIEHAELCLSSGFGDEIEEDADQNFNDDSNLRRKVEKIVVPQIEDDGNPEEWLQLMSYAFDDLDVPFNVGVAKTLLRDYGIQPHCDIEKRFGESIEEELEVVGEDKNSAALHRVNAAYSALKGDLARLVAEYRNDPDFDGIYLLDSLESLVDRYSD